MRPNKLEGLSLETLFSQVLEFEGKARANPIGTPFRCFLLVKLLVFPANVRLDWKGFPWTNPLAYLASMSVMKKKKFYTLTSRRVSGGSESPLREGRPLLREEHDPHAGDGGQGSPGTRVIKLLTSTIYGCL
jgi:hypothetical protein